MLCVYLREPEYRSIGHTAAKYVDMLKFLHKILNSETCGLRYDLNCSIVSFCFTHIFMSYSNKNCNKHLIKAVKLILENYT